MRRIPLNQGWQFTYGDDEWFMARQQHPVDLPHDFVINLPRKADSPGRSGNGYFGDGRGEYERSITISDEQRHDVFWLMIDGAYMHAEVYLDRDQLAVHPYGYTPFPVALTGRLQPGKEHRLRVITQARQPATRWYSGGGLFREVSLWTGPKEAIAPWEVFAYTKQASEDQALVAVSIQPAVRISGQASIRLLDAQGLVAAEASVPGGPDMQAELVVKSPQLWDTQRPYLYTLEVALQSGDIHSRPLGIRQIALDAQQGFRLNGKPMKLKGGCLHHDNGPLGAASFPAAEERRVRLLKAAGYNALRSSHNPPSQALLDACDKLGMLMMTESFDAWAEGKVALDYHLYFHDHWERDIEAMVYSARNHPCVFAYSIGNEIAERDGHGDGVSWAKKLADKVRALDPTRPVTAALNGFSPPDEQWPFLPTIGQSPVRQTRQLHQSDYFGDQSKPYCDQLDVVGYNYLWSRYAHDREKFPDRVIMGTETLASCTWESWQATLDNPNIAGDFIWTCWDYLGEAGIGRVLREADTNKRFGGPHPWHHSWCGDFDICGFQRPQSVYREIMWGKQDSMGLFSLHPRHHGLAYGGYGWEWLDVEPTWNYEAQWQGKPITVEAYADADEVLFLLNGVEVAREKVARLKARASITYQPGILEAKAYQGGQLIATSRLETAGKPASLRVKLDKDDLRADGLDLAYATITIVDDQGRPVPDQDVLIHATVSGGARLAAVGSGNPTSDEVYGLPYKMTYGGKALAIARAGLRPGRATLTISAQGLETVSLPITIS